MDDLWQQALADVVRAELALADRTAKDAYTSLGLSSTAWQTYFKKQNRDIPSRVLLALADYLGMSLSELMRKTEAREADLMRARPASSTRAELEAGLSKRGRRAVEEGRRTAAVEEGGDTEDPPDAVDERIRRSA